MRILFTGGGTGGHTTPIVAIIREVKRLYPSEHISPLELYFIGPKGAFEEEALKREGVEIQYVVGGKLRRYLSAKSFLDIFKVGIGLMQSLWKLYRIMPDIVWAKGGFGSLGVGLTSWLYRIPLVIHESDTVPGLTNRLLGIFSTQIGVSFESAGKLFPKEKTALVGNPIRETVLKADPEKARKYFKFPKSDRPVLMVMGGSQGAQKLNDLIAKSIHDLLPKYQIIHQVGLKNYNAFKTELKDVYGVDTDKEENYALHAYLDEREQGLAYSISDMFISRAGAGTIFEIAALGKPSILIPLPHAASNHQAKNAFHFARRGAAVVLQQKNLTPHLLLNEINHILDNPILMAQMAKRAKEIAKPEASLTIASNLMELAIKKRVLPEHNHDEKPAVKRRKKSKGK